MTEAHGAVEIEPFAAKAGSVGIGGLTVENDAHKLSLYGSLDIGRDKAGLANARALAGLLVRAVAVLEAAHDLPDVSAQPAAARTVPNPFA